jgi:hypothetical protein
MTPGGSVATRGYFESGGFAGFTQAPGPGAFFFQPRFFWPSGRSLTAFREGGELFSGLTPLGAFFF